MKTVALIPRGTQGEAAGESVDTALAAAEIEFTKDFQPDGLYYKVEDADQAAALAVVPEEFKVSE